MSVITFAVLIGVLPVVLLALQISLVAIGLDTFMLCVGIDEAGYGPLLGPLVVTSVAMRAGEATDPPDFWRLLSASVCRKPTKRDVRLAIDDSKKLYNPKTGVQSLERAALTVLATRTDAPTSLAQLLTNIRLSDVELDRYPWYRQFDIDLPVANDARLIAAKANAVRCDMSDCGVAMGDVSSEIILEGRFNREVGTTRNKSVVLAGAALRLVAQAVANRGSEPLNVTIDRHGGRKRYRDVLMTFFAPRHLRIVEESDERSAYELTDAAGAWTIEFVVKADQRSMPVALASIYSKYVRELLMKGLNAYFARRVSGLKPTAGYYTDAKRFLGQVDGAIKREGLDRQMLVRTR